jgi:hypothetical protein
MPITNSPVIAPLLHRSINSIIFLIMSFVISSSLSWVTFCCGMGFYISTSHKSKDHDVDTYKHGIYIMNELRGSWWCLNRLPLMFLCPSLRCFIEKWVISIQSVY